MVKIFVLDGRSLASLAIVRSLGKKGFEIQCGEEFGQNLTRFSKYVKKSWIYPSPNSNPEAFIEEIKRITLREKFDMIIPVRDDTTLLIAKYARDLSHITNLYIADYDAIRLLQDKAETIRIAHRCGVPHPLTYFPEETDLEGNPQKPQDSLPDTSAYQFRIPGDCICKKERRFF